MPAYVLDSTFFNQCRFKLGKFDAQARRIWWWGLLNSPSAQAFAPSMECGLTKINADVLSVYVIVGARECQKPKFAFHSPLFSSSTNPSPRSWPHCRKLQPAGSEKMEIASSHSQRMGTPFAGARWRQ
ncbi:hypothetical protein CC2G_010777 [Coprinopsis cinerea AmutBmut pab1-1]|nr:hypothetical protein CC2G_010777 [Coprinopsis cinerea AmutBmut pab1-1]